MTTPRTRNGTAASTKESALVCDLLGYSHYNGVAFTRDELLALGDFFGIDLRAESSQLQAAGDRRNTMRHAERDGLRVMAFLGKYLGHGEDPVNLVACGLEALGFDVPVDEESDQ